MAEVVLGSRDAPSRLGAGSERTRARARPRSWPAANGNVPLTRRNRRRNAGSASWVRPEPGGPIAPSGRRRRLTLQSGGSEPGAAGTPWWALAVGAVGVIGLLLFVPGLVGAAGMAGAFQFPFLSGVVLLGMLVLLSLTAVVFAAARLRSHRG